MQTKSCPAASDLQSFVRCDLPESRLELINSHLQECPECEAKVEALERQGDTVAVRLRRSVAQPSFIGEPECQALLNTLVEDATLAQSPAAPGSQTVGDHVLGSALESGSPDRLRDYRLLDKLGEGGMGTVYRAQHLRLKRTVAVKILPANRLSDPQSVARFEREMEVLGQLNHPHIVQALDAGEHDGRHYLVMEHVEGLDLAAIVKTHGPLSIANACHAISEAALGLQYAHEHGYVHRDIKPSNLMVAKRASTTDNSAHVKILDLGLARALDTAPTAQHGAVELTATSQVMGTLDYMAPEQGGDAHHVDIRADIYSLGATLYKLLTGDSPFAEHAHKPPLQRLMAMAASDPPPVQSKRADVPSPLAEIIHRMLGKMPDERFSTPAELVAALEPFCVGADLGELLGNSSANRATSRSATTQVATRVETRTQGNGRPRAPRAVALSFGGAALVALAVVLAVTTRHGTVVIESPDGKLPADVRVAISQGGEEVALLQADNLWSAKVVNGEYQLQLRGGDDRFELADSKIKVSRWGNKVVELHVRKSTATATPLTATNNLAANGAKPTPTTKESASQTTTHPKPAASSDRPFVLVRDGQELRNFKSLVGAIVDQMPGDVIEVRSNETLVAEFPSPIPETLSIRASAGFRPRLQFKEAMPGSAVPAAARWSFTGCDLDLRVFSFNNYGVDGSSECQLTGCGVWGGTLVGWSKFTAIDSILVMPMGGFGTGNKRESDVTLENCALQTRLTLFQIIQGAHKITMRHCTYYDVDGHAPGLIHVEEGASATIEASHCVFHRDSQNPNLIIPQVMPRVTWRGNDNCFSGPFSAIGELQADGSWKTLSEGLAAWNKRLKGTEQNPIERKLSFEWGRIQRLGEGRLAEIARVMQERQFGAEQVSIGPDWSLVGAGEAYVRALAAAGRPVADDALRPEQVAGGPFTLLSDGAEPRGFQSFAAALAAAPQDASRPIVVEIRSDGPFPAEAIERDSRRMTLRAAPGYKPSLDSLLFSGGAQVELEGLVIKTHLRFNDGDPPMGKPDESKRLITKLIRAMNCEVLNTNSGTFDARLQGELVNCNFGYCELFLDSETKPAIRNSVAFTIATTTIGKNGTTTVDQPPPAAKFAIERCLLFCPQQPIQWIYASLGTRTPTRIESRRTIYIAPINLIVANEFPKSWSGDENWFQFDSSYLAGGAPLTLSDLRKLESTDANSRELLPWQFDPRQWKILGDEPVTQGVDVTKLSRTSP